MNAGVFFILLCLPFDDFRSGYELVRCETDSIRYIEVTS